LLSQVFGTFTGEHGTYRVAKTVVGNPLYVQYQKAGYGPPYSTYAAAVTAAKKLAAQAAGNATPPLIPGEQPGAADTSAKPTFNLVFRNISGWFFRGLKIVFGAAMIIAGISKMTGVDNKITQLAGKLPVIPV
jgi:hypothetical protein